jgi:DNA-binding NarL/FixJ family response regulator
LTQAEIDLLRMVARGRTGRQIAETLSIDVGTVENRRLELQAKLGLRGRVEMMRYARDHGYLD